MCVCVSAEKETCGFVARSTSRLVLSPRRHNLSSYGEGSYGYGRPNSCQSRVREVKAQDSTRLRCLSPSLSKEKRYLSGMTELKGGRTWNSAWLHRQNKKTGSASPGPTHQPVGRPLGSHGERAASQPGREKGVREWGPRASVPARTSAACGKCSRVEDPVRRGEQMRVWFVPARALAVGAAQWDGLTCPSARCWATSDPGRVRPGTG